MKSFVLGVLILIIGMMVFTYFEIAEFSTEEANHKALTDLHLFKVKMEKIKKKINEADSVAKLDLLTDEVNKLPPKQHNHVQPYIGLKKSVILFNQGEAFLKRAAEIESAITVPQDLSQPVKEQKKLHPLTVEMLTKALDLYEEARKEADKYTDGDNQELNFNLNYLKGEIYYRYLEYLATPETAQELFNQTVLHYKQALKSKPADIDTVINVELLIKNQAQLLANASNPNAKRKQMLNIRKASIGRSTGF